MRSLPRLLLLLTLLFPASCATSPQAAAGCRAEPRALLRLTMVRNFLLVPATLDGMAGLMMLDTGAEASLLTPDAVRLLGLPVQSGPMLLGVDGSARGQTTMLPRLDLGGTVRGDVRFEVAVLPHFEGTRLPVLGLLGADVLGGYNLEIDGPAARAGLYRLSGCGRLGTGFAPPWPAVRVPLRVTQSGLLFVAASVNGRTIPALLDSGARTSLLTWQAAARAGVARAAIGRDPEAMLRGAGHGTEVVRRHRFQNVGVDDATVPVLEADVGEIMLPQVEMLLGADWLRQQHVWISPESARLFVATRTR